MMASDDRLYGPNGASLPAPDPAWVAHVEGVEPANDAPAPPREGLSAPASERPYVLENAEELAEPLPPITWLCEGLRLARGTVTIIGGYGYSRKTLYAQHLALSVATGSPVFGIYRVTQSPAVHIDGEQGHRITRERYQRDARARGLNLHEAQLSAVTFPRFRLNDPDARDHVRRLLEETRAGLLVIDSLRALLRGVEENSSEIREYIDLVGQEVKRVDAAAIFLHHARKPAGDKPAGRYSLRGSGAIFDAGDSIFVFSGEKGESTTVEHEKDRQIGTELPAFVLDSEDVARDDDPRWGLRLVHRDGDQQRQIDDADKAATNAAESEARVAAIRAALQKLPGATWQGSRSDLAAHVGGRRSEVLATISALASSGQIATTNTKTERSLRWVGP